jgi:hypothetical protein
MTDLEVSQFHCLGYRRKRKRKIEIWRMPETDVGQVEITLV